MALLKEQDEVLRSIDILLTLTEQMPWFLGDEISGNININPFDYLISIIEKFVTKEELVNFLIKFLTQSLPYVELAVKTAICSNLKQTIDCNNDPRIPNWLRLPIPGTVPAFASVALGSEYGTYEKAWDMDIFREGYSGGLLLNVFDMDYNGIFRVNPLSPYGKAHYFGCNSYYTVNVDGAVGKDEKETKQIEQMRDRKYYTLRLAREACTKHNIPLFKIKSNGKKSWAVDNIIRHSDVDSVYELVRARDMNAFLWLTINKGESVQWLNFETMKDGFTTTVTENDGTEVEIKKDWRTLAFEGKNFDKFTIAEYVRGYLVGKPQNAIWPLDLGTHIYQKWGNNSNDESFIKSLCFKKTVQSYQESGLDYNAEEDFGMYGEENDYSARAITTRETLVTANGPSKYIYEFVPYTSVDGGFNWYTNRKQYFEFLKPTNKRNYNERSVKHKTKNELGEDEVWEEKIETIKESKPICFFRHIKNLNDFDSSRYYTTIGDKKKTPSSLGKFRLDPNKNRSSMFNFLQFAILPKPLVHFDVTSAAIKKTITFDQYGEPTTDGQYSPMVEYTIYESVKEEVIEDIPTGKPHKFTLGGYYQGFMPKPYHVKEKKEIDGKEKTIKKTYYQVVDRGGNKTKYFINGDTGHACVMSGDTYNDASEDWKNDFYKYCYECYPHLTVYDFNYDFVFGMELFDPVVVTSQLLEIASKINFGGGGVDINFGISKSETEYQMRISEIVKKILNEDTSDVTDCFYSFSNEKYDKLLNEAENKRANMYPFQDSNNHQTHIDTEEVMGILSEFDNNGTLVENKEVLTRALTKVTANITEQVLPEDRYSLEKNIVVDLLKSITQVLVETLLSPKILILLEVNRQLMGNDGQNYNIEGLLESMLGLIVAVVSEIRDLVLKQILDWAIQIIMEKMTDLTAKLAAEQLKYYIELMRKLRKACAFKFPKRGELPSILDKVDYAEIDEVDKPKLNNC